MTRRAVIEREKGQEWVAPPGGNWAVEVKEGVGLRSIAPNNKQRSLGLERSQSEVGTSPPHDLYTPHGPVDRKTTTTT